MKDEYEIIFVPDEGRAIKDNKTNRIYYSEFQIIKEKNEEIERLQNIIKEVREYVKTIQKSENDINPYILHAPTILEILDKEKE